MSRADKTGRELSKSARAIAGFGLALLLLAAAPATGPMAYAAAPADPVADPVAFRAFVAAFRSEAERHGIGPAFFDETFAGMTPDPTVAALAVRQPEFSKPIGAYLAVQVTPARIATGHAMLTRWKKDLATIEKRYGVPGPIVVAVWGLETNYGASPGGKDVIRSIATLAAADYRPDLYPPELLVALSLLQNGAVPRERLRGSWAGAMGQPQFMPSSFATYAVDEDGDGKADIWTSVPDSLASIANFLAKQGWRADRPWGFEVRLPAGLDLGKSRGEAATWTARGVRRIDGGPLVAEGELTLFFPAGAAGPAFLVTTNYEVLKTYNFSDAYVLGTANLADRMAGGSPIRAAWPADSPISRDNRIALQARLAERGYTVDNREGRISLALRDVIRKAQASVGTVADGNPTDALLRALATAPPTR